MVTVRPGEATCGPRCSGGRMRGRFFFFFFPLVVDDCLLTQLTLPLPFPLLLRLSYTRHTDTRSPPTGLGVLRAPLNHLGGPHPICDRTPQRGARPVTHQASGLAGSESISHRGEL